MMCIIFQEKKTETVEFTDIAGEDEDEFVYSELKIMLQNFSNGKFELQSLTVHIYIILYDT